MVQRSPPSNEQTLTTRVLPPPSIRLLFIPCRVVICIFATRLLRKLHLPVPETSGRGSPLGEGNKGTSSLGKMIARGVRRGDYASRQRRGRAGNWKPRYSLNRERPRIFRVIRRPIAPPFPTAFTRGMPFHVCTDDAHTAYWLLLNVVSRHARFDALSLSLFLFFIHKLENKPFLFRFQSISCLQKGKFSSLFPSFGVRSDP